jgi:hypothetical protein
VSSNCSLPTSTSIATARLLPLIAIYAIFWAVWAGFAIPGLGRPTVIAASLHLVIILFIGALDRKNCVQPIDNARVYSPTNGILVIFSGAFFALTMLSKVRGDYWSYLQEWLEILDGHDPWAPNIDFNAYGPLFNALAPLCWITPLAAKLLFAFSYLFYVVWLIKDFGARRGLVALSWPVIVFWVINPFPWVEIAYYGQLDVLVALACVAAIHSQVRGKDISSGIYLALGVLVKYLPIIILPFLVFDKRRFHFRLFTSCVGLIILGVFMSVLLWGMSTFSPLVFATNRPSYNSIYELLSTVSSPLRRSGEVDRPPPPGRPDEADVSPNLSWLEKPLGFTAGLGVFTWCMVRQIGPALSGALAVLVTLLFYRAGFINYQMVPFLLLSYWAVSEWQRLKKHAVLAALLVGYFGFLAIVDFAIVFGLEGYTDYSMVVVLLKSVLGCALLGCLFQFSASRPSLLAFDAEQVKE